MIYDLGNGQWNIPALRELLERILPNNSTFDDYRVDHVFEGLGRRIMLMNGRRIDHMQLILLGISDVTEQQLAYEARNKSEARLAEAQRVGRLGSWEWDLKADEVRWSRELYTVYGLDPERFVPTVSSIRELAHPDDRAFRDAKIGEVASTGAPAEFDFRAVAADGSPRVLRARVEVSTFDEDGRPRVLTGVNQDITERKRTEEELQAATARLEETDRHKNEFLAMLSHELRNPLAPIRNSLYILDRATPGGEQARRAQAVIGRQVVQMTRLIEGLLDLTRMARGKAELQREVLDLNALTMRTVEDHRGGFVESGVDIVLPAATAEVWVNGDPTRLSQVIGNLLQNAAKFTPRGGKTTVSVEKDSARQQAIVRVQDTGRGITPEVQRHLFEPFTQADVTIDRKMGGLGLGLALARGLIEMHGGSVTATSGGVDKGATFTITLPLEASGPVDAPRPSTNAGQTVRRVLLIEDNADAADSLREALQLAGHEVEVAYNGSEGIGKARAFQPEVVICDIGLPEMDGYEVARAIRSDPELRRVRLVALTGYAGPDDIAKSKKAGFDAHLAKPLGMEEIERVLQPRS
jgi:two-component system CheB/CheR fusion protein